MLEVYRPGHQVMLTKVHDRKHSPDGESDNPCYDENTPSSVQPAYENIEKVTEKRWRSESICKERLCESSKEKTAEFSCKEKRHESSFKKMRHESSCYHKLQEKRSNTSTTRNIENQLPWQQGASFITSDTACTQTVRSFSSISSHNHHGYISEQDMTHSSYHKLSHHGYNVHTDISHHKNQIQPNMNHHGNHRQPDTSRNDPRKSQTREFHKSYQRSCLQRVFMTTTIKDDTTLAPDCSLVSEEGTISRHCGAYSDDSDSDSLTSSPCGGATFPDMSLSSEEHSSCRIQQAALQSLLECEQDFVDVMHRGIQMFSRPLRHHILTSQQHSDTFQNIEKVNINIS